MLLSITNKNSPATDLGYLLHKNPARCQQIDLAFGKAYVFFSEATDDTCTATLLLDIDPIGMVRGKAGSSTSGPLDQYVNDRPYVASSFLSVAIAKVFGSALQGKCKNRPDLVDTALPLTVRMSVLPCRGGVEFLSRLFEPLGYAVNAKPYVLDDAFKEWGDSVYYTVELARTATLKEVLTHLYVLIPVLDNQKHYYVGAAELENLLAKGDGWLSDHPEKKNIAKRYLKHNVSLARQALARLTDQNQADDESAAPNTDDLEVSLEKPLSLNEQRIQAVLAKVAAAGAKSVIDLGCGDGKLLRELIKDKSLTRIAGMDVSIRSLEFAHRRIGMDRLPGRIKEKITLFHGSLMYKDKRFSGYDAALAVEVVEHLDPPRLEAFEKVVFEHAQPKTIVITTPNREYNAMWDNLSEGALRHGDHRFEWTRDEFKHWAEGLARQYHYAVAYYTIGPESPTLGSPTQMGVFTRADQVA
jgi:3' terminal RNA ribose 2'-O-methyltransferase Hen1